MRVMSRRGGDERITAIVGVKSFKFDFFLCVGVLFHFDILLRLLSINSSMCEL